MNDLQVRSALESGSSSSPGDGGRGSVELASVWPRVFFGTFAAMVTACVVCWLPQPLKFSKGTFLFVRAVMCVLLTAQVGHFVVGASARRSAKGSGISARWVSLHVGTSWVLLPCIVLLYLQHSFWMLALTVVAAALLAVCVRELCPDVVERAGSWTDGGNGVHTNGVPTFAALPVERSGWWSMPVISVCAQVSLLPILMGDFFVGSLLLAVCSFLLVWRLSALRSGRDRVQASERAVTRRWGWTSAIAIVLTWLLLVPWIGKGAAGALQSGGGDAGRRSMRSARDADRSASSTDYVGIILWPPPQKKVRLIVPAPHEEPSKLLKESQPVVIPFDGPYWYYKAPQRGPGPKAHVVHGRPTLVNVHSTDWSPLLMEAHQHLGTPIDLGCCRELDVAITNADRRPGEIAIGVMLRDSGTAGRPTQLLGERPIVSSEEAHIAMDRPPVDEVLRFTVPQTGRVRRFDEITIVFSSARERARGGAQVSIDHFKLVPR